MEKHLPILFIVVGLILFILGGYNYLNPSKYLWQEKKADLTKVDIESKKIRDHSMNRLVISYQYKVGSIIYQGIHIDNWKLINNKDSDNFNKEKHITIYHNHKNPNISYINRPNEGIYRMAFGLIFLIFGALLYFSSNNEQTIIITEINKKSQESDLVSSELPLL
jgi:hypothetical protein